MKIALVNGSPHENGCTNRALTEIKNELLKEGIASEIFWIGNEGIPSCRGCGACVKLKKCVINDKVNEFAIKLSEYDGFVFGSPVHYAAISGDLSSFMSRLFYSAKQTGNFYLKPAAGIAVARRAGTLPAFDQLNKFFTICEMPVISSTYWNMAFGSKPADVEKDEEGLLTMRNLARNMAFFLKCKEAGIKNGVKLPEKEAPLRTSFIR